MNESEVRALVRDEMRTLVGSMAEAADWYTDGCSDMTESAAHLVKDVAARMASDLATEPVNPFAPKRTAEQWAVILRATIDAAAKDGYDVWVDVEYYEGPRPKIHIGPTDSTGADDPIICGETK